jgi:tetratricopeptide (TPR) repeat protein
MEERVLRMVQLFRRRGFALSDAQLMVAQYFLDFGEAELAERFARRSLDMNPACAPCLSLLGQLCMLRADTSGAEGWFLRSQRVDPGYKEVRFWLGDLAWNAGEWKEAEAHYRAYLQTDSVTVKADTAFARLSRAMGPGTSGVRPFAGRRPH